MTPPQREPQLCRRKFVLTAAKLAICAGITAPSKLRALPISSSNLKFYNLHTQESFEICEPFTLCSEIKKKQLNTFLRDFRTGEVYPMDFRLMKILSEIQKITGSRGTYEVISGFRSKATNSQLRAKSKNSGVARKSLHLVGQAIDVRLSDLHSRDLKNVAISLKAGGVGYYPKSNFVHIDTGRVRTW